METLPPKVAEPENELSLESSVDREELARLLVRAPVPTVAGRYRFNPLSHSRAHQGSHEVTIARLRRVYDQDGRLSSQQPSAMAAHPATGSHWVTAEAVASRPALETLLARPVEASQ
jgi:hypothetical protein